MRIGIDTHFVTSAHATGNRTYTAETVRALIAVDYQNEYVLYAVEDDPYYWQFVNYDRVTVRQVLSRNGLLRNFVSLPRESGRDAPDVVHLEFILPPFIRAATVVTVPDLHYVHSPVVSWYERSIGKLTVWSLRRADWVITHSEYARRDIAHTCSVDPHRISVIPHGVDQRFMPSNDRAAVQQIRQRLGIHEDYILFVGRTEDPRKNVATLIEAYVQLRSQGSITAQLVIAGKHGSATMAMQQRVKVLGQDGMVLMPGIVPDADLPLLLSGARVFVYVSSFEGFGLPVLEAMACGIPVITSNVTSLPEVAGDAALLVTPGRIDELAQTLRLVLSNGNLRQQMRERGLRQAKRFSWERAARETLSVYEKAERQCKSRSGQS